MNIFNVFKLENMPTEETAQDAAIKAMFEVRNLHIHMTEDGGYYLVRKTAVTETDGVKITKLRPDEDAELMEELVSIMIESEANENPI